MITLFIMFYVKNVSQSQVETVQPGSVTRDQVVVGIGLPGGDREGVRMWVPGWGPSACTTDGRVLVLCPQASLMMNFQPPSKAWRASQMMTFFIFLLFFPSFTGVLCTLAITIWR